MANHSFSPVQSEIVEMFVRLAVEMNMPRSMGEIYGALFVSEGPLCMDDLIDILDISKGSASQGLRFLKGLGAVKTVYISGERRDYYEAEIELRKLVSGLLREKVQPHLEDGKERLAKIRTQAGTAPDDVSDELQKRIEQLGKWQKRGERLMPLVLKLVEY